ncbi:Deoxycytidine triphosphate deaminase [invertebrate metagenome]|uniref:Deoxycytidine triphosphate deaminase n=1 Tax=invertebrate metagenome TaxID=1711999 RepID=A0A484HAG4_9ZZZZ
MKLADVDIRAALAAGRLRIDPRPTEQEIGAVSVDLRLGAAFRVFVPGKAAFVDLAPSSSQWQTIEHLMQIVEIQPAEAFYLHPGAFALGMTQQRITLPADIAGRLDGRSSLARIGLMVHATAHTIDPGWDGRITLEFFNCGPLLLAMRAGMQICALSFEPLLSPTSKPYADQSSARYRGQDSPLPSRLGRGL